MKKILFALFAMVSMTASAHVFDGIDLNQSYLKITREIATKGYIYDETKDCLKGNCQGTEIYLSFNLTDTKEKNKIGQLIVDIPMKNATAFEDAAMIFNVIYHVTNNAASQKTYSVDTDGTTMDLIKTADGIKLVYSTPNYKK